MQGKICKNGVHGFIGYLWVYGAFAVEMRRYLYGFFLQLLAVWPTFSVPFRFKLINTCTLWKKKVYKYLVPIIIIYLQNHNIILLYSSMATIILLYVKTHSDEYYA